MGTIASKPAPSARSPAARQLAHVGRHCSGASVKFAFVLEQKVPSFSLLSLKSGLVGPPDTASILPEIRSFTQRLYSSTIQVTVSFLLLRVPPLEEFARGEIA